MLHFLFFIFLLQVGMVGFLFIWFFAFILFLIGHDFCFNKLVEIFFFFTNCLFLFLIEFK